MPSPYLTVAEDVEYLRDKWFNNPDEPEIRRNSGVLRRLLVDGVLRSAWRHHGFAKEPTIRAPRLRVAIDGPTDHILIAIAGGATVNGERWENMVVAKDDIDARLVREGADEELYFLTGFLDSPAAVAQGEVFSRRDVIKYFANHAGGVHLRADGHPVSSRTRKRDDELMRRMERKLVGLSARDKEALYFELISIGQATAKSTDVEALLRRIRDNSHEPEKLN